MHGGSVGRPLFPHRRDHHTQHSSSTKAMNNALKMIRIGDSESPRHALSNDIALVCLYGKVKCPCSHSQLETLGTLPPLPPWPSSPRPALLRAGSGSRVIIIPTLDSEAPADRCKELCNLFVDLLNGDQLGNRWYCGSNRTRGIVVAACRIFSKCQM